jgi:hypothetical protein
MSDKVKAIVTLTITYVDENGQMSCDDIKNEIKHLVARIGSDLAGDGRMSGSSEVAVDEWSQEVQFIDLENKGK